MTTIWQSELFVVVGLAVSGCSMAAEIPIPKRVNLLATGGLGAANNLTNKLSSAPAEGGKPILTLQWTPAAHLGAEQRVIVTIFPDGFERGAFETSELLRSNQTSLVWTQLKGQAIHRWKVLTLQPQGWIASETASFEGPIFIRDYMRTPNSASANSQDNQQTKERSK